MTPDQRKAFPPESVQLRDGTSVTFRLLTPEDNDRLAQFYSTVPKEDFRFYCPHRLDRENAEKNAAVADNPGQIVLVVIDGDDEIAGYAWVRGAGDTGSFGACLRKDFQGKGVGGKLIAKLFEIVDEVGPPLVKLTVQTANPGAVALYKRNGFRVVKEGLRQADPKLGTPEEPQFWMERVRQGGRDNHA